MKRKIDISIMGCELFNFVFFVLMQLNDSAADGDRECNIIYWKMQMLYYKCNSGEMKYTYETYYMFKVSIRRENQPLHCPWSICKPKRGREFLSSI